MNCCDTGSRSNGFRHDRGCSNWQGEAVVQVRMTIAAGIWEHYKGGFYQALGVAAHSEPGERMVVYVSLTGIGLPGPRFCVRPLDSWLSVVKWPDGYTMPRFVYKGVEL